MVYCLVIVPTGLFLVVTSQCAVKIIDKRHCPREYYTKRLPHEIKALFRVRKHPHIVSRHFTASGGLISKDQSMLKETCNIRKVAKYLQIVTLFHRTLRTNFKNLLD